MAKISAERGERVKGCKKNVLLVKGQESELFEEAYFIMRDTDRACGMRDIVAEAQRIIEQSDLAAAPAFVKLNRKKKLQYFFIGIALACAIWGISLIIIFL